MVWSKLEMAEATLILGGTGGTWALTETFAWDPSYGKFICYSAALLLGQGLIRDLVKKAIRPKAEEKADQPIQKCLCAESSLGLLLILVGVLMLSVGISKSLEIDRKVLTIAVGLILTVGFLIKDYVLSVEGWSLSVRKEKDHDNVIIWR